MAYTNNPTDQEAAYAPPKHHIAEIYARWTLDYVIKVASAIAQDFENRPRLYRQISENVANTISGFRALVGSHPDWPNVAQRMSFYSALLCNSFCAASVALREAAITFSGQASDIGRQMSYQVFLDTVVTLRACLNTLDRSAVAIGDKQTRAIFGNATEIMRSQEVAQVFGLMPAPSGEWPLGGDLNGNAAYLIEEVTRRLYPWTTNSQRIQAMSQQRFMVLQRVAHYGALTIAGVLDDSSGWEKNNRIEALVRNAYTWASALKELVPDIIRAWKDQLYRQSLSEVERAQLPDHPAGDIDLKGTGMDISAARLRNRLPDLLQSITTMIEPCCCDSFDYCNTLSPICKEPDPEPLPPLTICLFTICRS